MSTEPPPSGSGQFPDDDPLRKQPPPAEGGGSPYDTPSTPPPHGQSGGGPYAGGPYGGDAPGGAYPGGPGGPYGGGPYGGDPYGSDPLAGMPPLADPGKRVLARVIDMVVVGIVVVLVGWAIFGSTVYGIGADVADDVDYGRNIGHEILAAVLYLAYDTFFTARNGQTPGKRLMKLRTANLGDGSTPSVQTALLRAAVLWIPFAFCCACFWTVIAGGWSFFDKPYRQGLHDKAARTVVVSTG
ncbi:RDD family protein [Streptomyces poonensis]|uniref:RDD domain-containing protein n=1 Tax=Streptomyces poonensis TaxID=68255 RepID=A0A918PTK5_9ACTN|nr:RDD family protein [Streptomyces poonensis]GGZ22280.1 hypothetical protein GCM10010365_48090 [Streptomyces poonensis]GLJ91794.1 hypothetical protein GCM10017589_44020 [Streptomyces poonensis]